MPGTLPPIAQRGWRRHCPPWPWLLAALAGLLLIGTATLLHLRQNREQAYRAELQDLATLARVAAEHFTSEVRALDRTLLLLRTVLESQQDSFDLSAWTQSPSFRNEMIVQVALIGPDGLLRATNVGPTTQRMDLSDREHFRVHLGDRPDALFISRPVLGRATGRWTLQLTRRFATVEGGFGGVIVASVDIRGLAAFYEAVGAEGETTLLLLGQDGAVRASTPFEAARLSGEAPAPAALLARLGPEESGAARLPEEAGANRLMAFRRLADLPLTVAVLRTERYLAGELHTHERLVGGGAAALGLLGLLLLFGSHALQRRQRETARALDAMLASISQGLQVTGPDGIVLVTNPRTASLLSLPPDLARPGVELKEIRDWLAGLAGPGAPPLPAPGEEKVIQLSRQGGRVLEVRASRLGGGGVVHTFTDITAQHRAAAALTEARDAAEAGLRSRARFLATMSHEIRTPINGVIGLAELLLGSQLDPQQRLWVDRLQLAADHLLRLVDDVLDFTRLDQGRMPFEQAAFHPARVAEEAFRLLESRAQAKGLAWTLDMPEAPPPPVLGDAGRLRQVLLNLLGNALKFTEAGSVSLTLRAVPVEENKLMLSLAVRDSGIGIPAAALPALFQDFSQVDGSISRRFGGSGLGLAICARLVAQMGGQITVDSQPGTGSCFRLQLRLPLAPAEAAAAPAPTLAPPPAEAAPGPPLRILLAEDDPTNRMVVLAMLARLGHAARPVENGRLAVEALQQEPFDLVLMDLMMPEMDGLTATRAIRALPPPLDRQRIVALTANALPEDARRCREAGMDDVLTKPLRLAALQAMLARQGGRVASAAPAPATPAPAAPAQPEFDPRPLRDMAAELGEESCSAIRAEFLRELEERMARLPVLAASGPVEALRREAHSLKSAAAAFGLVGLSRAAAQIESSAAKGSMPDLSAPLAALAVLAAQGREWLDQQVSGK
ncbi:ATP-binding protein [Roseomonas sp. GC11]|uniref:ATP-binding protein n=1 Tax=Roseomonas sp. GC11 TaxID=2950546 RepID=UPI00210A7FD9|nr:ATP-binding protein [Roseomonas sp. GC11]MCQ4162584.1 ATP-binding protein [Roseomonas sp. GC11]